MSAISLFKPALEAAASRQGDDPLARSMREALRARCEAHLTPGAEAFIDYETRASEWWARRAGGRIIPRALEHLAFGHHLFGEARYGAAARAILMTLVEHRIVENTGGTNYGRPYRTWRDNVLDAGAASVLTALAYDLLRPVLSDEERDRAGRYLIPFVDYVLENEPDREIRKPDYNIPLIGTAGMGLLALVLHDAGVLDTDRRDRAVARTKVRCRAFLERGHDGDGSFFEGPAYGCASLKYMAPLTWALAERGDRELIDHAGWDRIVEGLLYEIVPGTGRINPLNDCGDVQSLDWLALLAAQRRDGRPQWLWQSLVDPNVERQEGGEFLWTRYLLYYDPAVRPTPPGADMPKAKHFRGRGLVDVRTGWGREDTFVSFLCDPTVPGGHRQADRNHFSVHALGESFAVDSGYALERLPDTTEVLRLGATGGAHSVPLVHGGMQRSGVAGRGLQQVRLEGWAFYVEGEAGEGYTEADRFTRRLAYLPDPSGPGCVIIGDLLTLREPRTTQFTWLLHTAAGNRVELTRDAATVIGGRAGHRCLVQIVTPWPGRWQVETFFDHPRLRYDWFRASLQALVVLAPYRKGEAPPEVTPSVGEEGVGLKVVRRGCVDVVLSAAAGQTAAFEGVTTDAELAVVRRREGGAQWMAAGGRRLAVDGEEVVALREAVGLRTGQGGPGGPR
ncbi:MAG: hypothetical protein A3F84_03540 [Candidatus Handelsmanbacteria bacterium RIFCSPLOWO2_12_FULL_64_10]|uniref:Heparinase II N-terminal domain-containing protein n=1 Tax=Handelsmanbacteria sp. (strain RIFCSPLOWO2_12_FULL_64_10) TaxID=1817868 RepID=A0A1F6CCW4_HANXR|nr:MAG: hypothetical protein A3F84_03540 [Candidatus Handelsmanbacteria bacterium RIFCSPLOWO2_12_FULL_64_10]